MDELLYDDSFNYFDRKERFEMGRKELRSPGFNDGVFKQAVIRALFVKIRETAGRVADAGDDGCEPTTSVRDRGDCACTVLSVSACRLR